MQTLSVILNDEFASFVERSVSDGRFHSTSEVVAVAVATLRAEASVFFDQVENLRREIGIGVAQADAEDFVEFDAETIIAEADACRTQGAST